MADITRFTQDDLKPVLALYRRVFGADAAEANRLRWEWQYKRNPCLPPEGPLTWIAREGPTIVGQYATMPVRLWVQGQEIQAAWGMDVMVAPERQRQGLGEVLFRTWDQHVGAALGLGLSESSYRLFQKMRWPNVGPVPVLVKPLTRRALRQPSWPMWANRLVSALTLPVVHLLGRARPLRAEVSPIDRFGDEFTTLWERLAPKFDFAVRRDAPYLNWKFFEAPHVRYKHVALHRGGEVIGYAVYRHLQEARGKVTQLIDFLVDPDDDAGMTTILRWLDREARAADSDKVRTICMHESYRRVMRHAGYFQVKSTVEFITKLNAVEVGPEFYGRTGAWHVTLGDSDQDR
jgi:hypothetical protein